MGNTDTKTCRRPKFISAPYYASVVLANIKGGESATTVAYISAFFQTNGFEQTDEIAKAFGAYDIVRKYNIDVPEDNYDIDKFLLELKKQPECADEIVTSFVKHLIYE